MKTQSTGSPGGVPLWAWLLLMVLLLTVAGPVLAAPSEAVLGSILGNQERMIQIGLILVAIGIFILTRSHK